MKPWQQAFYGQTVFITGHTGFKGSWLSLWLHHLGARVVGYSLPPPTNPNLFTLAKLSDKIVHIEGDIRDPKHLQHVLGEYQPSLVFHLAAQPLVLTSYEQPVETMDTNVMGTIHLLEAIRHTSSVKAGLMITTDKCYENKGWLWGYREIDRLGGHDPYSASKAMTELAIASYRDSFFHKTPVAIASARAGNVIGGGDFSNFRLLPDAMKALMENRPIVVRNPRSIRPWLYILDALNGYLQLASKLMQEGKSYADAWNFGPLEQHPVTTQMLIEKVLIAWKDGTWIHQNLENPPQEMATLRLSWEKAAHALNWHPHFRWEEAIKETVHWFKGYQAGEDMYEVSLDLIKNYQVPRKKVYAV